MEKITGIYKISCISNKKVYVGSSVHIMRRIKKHFYELENNIHANLYLQRTYNKNGSNDFHYEIIEKCNKEKLQKKEQYYIDLFNCSDENNGFNLLKFAYTTAGRKHTEKTKMKMKIFHNTELQKQKYKIRSSNLWKIDEYRNSHIIERKIRWKNPQFIKKMDSIFNTEKYKLKRSEIAKKMWNDPNKREILINERISRGKDLQYKEKLSLSAKKKWKDPKFIKAYSEAGKKKWLNEEFRVTQGKKISIAMKEKWKDPEYAKMMKLKRMEAFKRKKECNMS
jgi:group I intron endonuclease